MDSRISSGLADWVDEQMAAGLKEFSYVPDTARALTELRLRRDVRVKKRRRAAWVAAGAMTCSLAALSFPATRAYAQICARACVEETGRMTQFILDRVSSQPVTAVARQVAPDFTLTDADGNTVQLSSLRGKVVFLNFWATWCPPCREEIPWFMKFQDEYKGRGLSVVGVSVDEEGWKAVRPFLAGLRVNYPVVVGGDDIIRLYGGLDSLPTTLVIDRSGRVAATHVGLVSRGSYEAGIQAVLDE